MLLTIDIGNTNTTLGIFQQSEIIAFWRAETRREWTADEVALLLKDFFGLKALTFSNLTGAAISNVVPSVRHAFESMCERYLQLTPLYIDHHNAGVSFAYPHPEEIGADRLVTCLAAHAKYKTDLVVIDFGTATTFDYVDRDGRYHGGPIAPGVAIANEALYRHTAKLPRVDIQRPERILPSSTEEAIQAGIYFGYVGLVESIVERMKKAISRPVKVIATGGLASFIAQETRVIEATERYLTLDGLRIAWERNK